MTPGSAAGDRPDTTVLCASGEFRSGAANPVLDLLPSVIVVRREDRGTSAELHALAREAGMSRAVFAERFTALLGRTPIQYLTAWRSNLADEMLRTGQASVAQAAGPLGYETETAFRRAFKRVRAIAPRAVRRSARDAGTGI